ncbi:suppressor of fused domain protein [Novosphingobium colocasiae]|uniref:suppressor of fused domain protein n=1 Tax=Novosphingobium colocasiae TaxID=1256513 RepID=UPI001E61F00C|nr:suppressor of fused domain protein [Novosphingobium colocasiae]
MWQTNIENHYEDVWSTRGSICEFFAGPIGQLPNGFVVLKFPPHNGRKMWTYATRCMSLPDDHNPLELHIFSPFESGEVVELLFATAHFHRTSTKLRPGDSVNFGKPWINPSECNYGLISLPYLDGKNLENLSIGARLVKFYWLIPITSSEVMFKKAYGLEALEIKLDQSGFDYVNPLRKSVV